MRAQGKNLAAIATVLCVAACQHAGGISSTAARGAAAGSDPGCQVTGSGGNLRPGATITNSMAVVSDGRSCIWGAGLSGVTQSAPTLSEKPAHGVVQLQTRGQSILYSYRPTPGYSGHDSFAFVLHRDDGFDDPVEVGVSVRAPGE